MLDKPDAIEKKQAVIFCGARQHPKCAHMQSVNFRSYSKWHWHFAPQTRGLRLWRWIKPAWIISAN